MNQTKKSANLSKGRTNSKKIYQYSDVQNQEIIRGILLRLEDADSAVRTKQPFKDAAQHLTGQLTGREYEAIKTKLNKMLKAEVPSRNNKPSPESRTSKGGKASKDSKTCKPSLIHLSFFNPILVQALQGKRAFEVEVDPQYKGIEDQITRNSTSGSLGKRTPLSTDTAPMLYAYKQNDEPEVYRSRFEQELEAESQLGCSLSDYESNSEYLSMVSPCRDLLKPADADYYASYFDHFNQITEDLDCEQLFETLEDDPTIAQFPLDIQAEESLYESAPFSQSDLYFY